ncbi:hypothetical protein BDY21DRAFT_336191 [Lineolata rhizophorae]|uniref:Uncharacterized protein n=1 Tax=Lineolata rhizophorae TaxID=578093 RepID=A0A6A6PA74_9PEZI|nr:hypothetical protein BDY21DRAFT_336191 [Lineolata rhizophorae]
MNEPDVVPAPYSVPSPPPTPPPRTPNPCSPRPWEPASRSIGGCVVGGAFAAEERATIRLRAPIYCAGLSVPKQPFLRVPEATRALQFPPCAPGTPPLSPFHGPIGSPASPHTPVLVGVASPTNFGDPDRGQRAACRAGKGKLRYPRRTGRGRDTVQ